MAKYHPVSITEVKENKPLELVFLMLCDEVISVARFLANIE